MTFDREALKGIYNTLTPSERVSIVNICEARGVGRRTDGWVTDEYLILVQQVMVELGHIQEFHISSSEVAAQEYEEILAAQELMGE